MERLREFGVAHEWLDRDALASAEPALSKVADKLVGGLRTLNDETGDCYLFTTRLSEQARALGVRFLFHTRAGSMMWERNRIKGARVTTTDGKPETMHADRYLLALGSYSRELPEPLQLDLPVYPIKGYSLTLPLVDADAAPLSTVMNETCKVAMTRFDSRIRVGGMAELGGFDLRLNPRRRQTLEMVVGDMFPGAGDVAQAEFWTGHGTPGWTMACGSGRLVADLVTERQPAIRHEALALARYGKVAVSTPDRQLATAQ